MSRRLVAVGGFLACVMAAPLALAQSGQVVSVAFQGPGGHSNGNYGRTNAVHAAALAITDMAASMDPSTYVVSDFGGGNSVNSIASDAHFKVRLSGDVAAARAALAAAVKSGVESENAFRGVKPGDLAGGVPAGVSYTIEP